MKGSLVIPVGKMPFPCEDGLCWTDLPRNTCEKPSETELWGFSPQEHRRMERKALCCSGIFLFLIPFLSKLEPQSLKKGYQKEDNLLFEKPSAHLNPTAEYYFPKQLTNCEHKRIQIQHPQNKKNKTITLDNEKIAQVHFPCQYAFPFKNFHFPLSNSIIHT